MRRAPYLCLAAFLVTWKVFEQKTVPCPDDKAHINAYTGNAGPFRTNSAVLCSDGGTSWMMSKTFENKADAETFVNHAPRPTMHGGLAPSVYDFKIQEVQ